MNFNKFLKKLLKKKNDIFILVWGKMSFLYKIILNIKRI